MDWKKRLGQALERAGHTPDNDVVEELAQHAAAQYEQARAEGHTPDAAEAAVHVQIAEWIADGVALRHPRRRRLAIQPPAAGGSWFAGIAHDIRYAFRLLRRRPGATIVTVLTMSLGIGATTILFSVVSGVLLKPLPLADAERLVTIRETREGSTRGMMPFMTNGTYLAWKDSAATVEGLAGWSGSAVTMVAMVAMTGAGDPQRVTVASVTATFFPLLRATTQLGDAFTAADEAAANVTVISDGLWRRQYGARPDVLGRIIQFDGTRYTIVGVMSEGFAFPAEAVAWIPFRVRPVVGANPEQRYISMFSGVARLRPGVSPEQAAAEGTARGRQAPDGGVTAIAVFGSRGPVIVGATPMFEAMTSEVRPALMVFMAAVGLLFLAATANVASVQLARATTRRRELAIRAAIGAGGARIGRQLLVESVITGLVGCAGGLLLAFWLHRFLPVVLPADFPRVKDIAIDPQVILFAVGISVIASLLFGCLPALQARRMNLVASIAEDGTAPVGSGRSRTSRARASIMAGQVAIAVVLLVGASLLIRSFNALVSVDRGFDVQNILTARVPMPSAAYNAQRRAQVIEGILNRMREVPGVSYAAWTSVLPLTSTDAMLGFELPPPPDSGRQPVSVRAGLRIVSADYFRALNVRVIEGRGFDAGDTRASQPAVVVNREFARQYLDGRPLGRLLPAGLENDRPEWRVVGVVENILPRNLDDKIQPELFVPSSQLTSGISSAAPALVIRTVAEPAAVASILRGIVREQDRSVALESVMTMEARLLQNLARPRLFAVVLAFFAFFALTIAGVGLFGVLSYSVAQRSREIGVRAALGAQRSDLVGLVVKQGAVVTAGGLLLGLGGAWLLARSVSRLLYGVSPADPFSFIAVPSILAVVAIGACVVPAKRAASVDPLDVLRR
jgi:putative ABC transport system permease protein